MSEMKFQIGKTMAAALKTDVLEINQAFAARQIRVDSNNRFVAALIKDAGYDPVLFGKYELIEENGESFLVSAAPDPLAPKE